MRCYCFIRTFTGCFEVISRFILYFIVIFYILILFHILLFYIQVSNLFLKAKRDSKLNILISNLLVQL